MSGSLIFSSYTLLFSVLILTALLCTPSAHQDLCYAAGITLDAEYRCSSAGAHWRGITAVGLLAVQQYRQPERAWFPAGPAGTLLGSAQEGMLAPGVMLVHCIASPWQHTCTCVPREQQLAAVRGLQNQGRPALWVAAVLHKSSGRGVG